MGVGSNWTPCSVAPDRRQCFVLEPAAEVDFFPAKLGIITDDCMHQVFDQLLSDRAILLTRQFRDCLCDRVDDFICFLVVDFIPARCRSLRLARKSRRR